MTPFKLDERLEPVNTKNELDEKFFEPSYGGMSEITIDDLVALFGSQAALASSVGVGKSAVSNWRREGIPDSKKWRIVDVARQRGMPIDPEQLGLTPRAAA